MSAAMMMSDPLQLARDLKAKVNILTPSTVASDLDTPDVPQLDLNAETKISHYDHAFPVSKHQPEPETQSHLTLAWDQAFATPAQNVVKPLEAKASIAAAWETAFGVPRPRNELMHAAQSTNSTPPTTWDAAFKATMPVARFPEMPAAAMPSWDRVFRVS
jgi:hypothetical protein